MNRRRKNDQRRRGATRKKNQVEFPPIFFFFVSIYIIKAFTLHTLTYSKPKGWQSFLAMIRCTYDDVNSYLHNEATFSKLNFRKETMRDTYSFSSFFLPSTQKKRKKKNEMMYALRHYFVANCKNNSISWFIANVLCNVPEGKSREAEKRAVISTGV